MNRGNFALEGDDEIKRNCCGLRGRGFEDFSRQDLRDIILHKNKVIADLEEHAYGSASWIDALNKGLKKANEIKGKVDKKPPKETDEEFRKRLEEFDKGSAPTEAWGADELDGGGVVMSRPIEPAGSTVAVGADGTVRMSASPEQKRIVEEVLGRAGNQALMATGWQMMMPDSVKNRFLNAFRSRDFIRTNPLLLRAVNEHQGLIKELADTPPVERDGFIESRLAPAVVGSLMNAISDSGGDYDTVFTAIKRSSGGAAVPTPKAEPKVSPVAAAAAVLAPVREKIQNGIGDALYGKSDDPKKQKKGLLGISEEGKEESKKKVMKNIVVPIVKTAVAFGKNVKDTANMIFNPSQYDADMKAERIQRIKKDEAQAGIVRDKENPMIIIRKPRGYWDAETTDPTEEAYHTKRIAKINRDAKTQEERDKDIFYIRVPNPLFAAKLRPSFQELAKAGFVKQVGNEKQIDLWTGVQQLDPKVKEDIDGTLQRLHDDEFIWIPEDRAKDIYGKLRQFVADKQDEGVAEGFESLGWSKAGVKDLLKIDPRTLKGQDLIDYKQTKLLLDKTLTQNALDKVNKDIKDEEAKANPDTVRLGKMREGKERVLKRQKDLVLRGQQEFKDMMLWAEIEGRKRDLAYKERMAANAAIPDEVDEFNAKPVAEKIAILEGYIADPNANETEIAQFTEQLEQLRAQEASEKVENQAQGSVDLLQQAEVEGGAKPTNPALYEKAKAIVNKSYPKHSAYRSGAYVKKYKEMGGEYEDEPDGKRPLERWFKEDWKDVGNKEYPVYRPTKRISKDTPLTPDEIDPENLKLQIKEKQKIKGDRNLSAFEKRGGFTREEEEELLGAGAVEYTLNKAGMRLFNPTRDLSKAERQSFTPDYDAYGLTAEQGRQNAFNLSRSMYDQSKAIELPDFRLLKDDTSLRFYRKDDENVILVGIRGTDVKSWTDLYTWAVIGVSADLRLTTRFQEDLAKLVAFQRNYPPSQFYYVATGSSLAGSIADRFLELGLIEEAITYNPSIERKHLLDETILNHRIYLDTDPLFILMGQYSPNTEIRVNPNKTNYYNPSKEKDYLIKSHSIYPVYNPAFEGGGMEGSGKTYTLEEWKAIFDAKLEQKRKAIEAREAKKKQTAKAKRERAKARREEREKPKAPEPEEEEEEPEVEVAEYTMGDEVYWVEEPREGLAFDERRVFDSDQEEIGKLTVDDVGKTLVKMVMRQEKIGAFADKSPKAKSSSESLPFFESKQPKSPEPEEEEEEDVEVSTYTYKGKEYDIEDPKGEEDMNLEFYANRGVWQDDKSIGKLGDKTPLMKALMKLVIKQEFPSEKDYRETMGLDAKAPRKPKAPKAPASARVELREELVAEQPRSPAGEFAKPEETAVVAVSQAPQRAYMKLMKSPAFTEADRRLFMRIRETKMTPRMRAVLLGRSGLARKVMDILGLDESAFQSQRARARIADTTEKRVKGETVRGIVLPDDIEVLFQKQEAGLINYIANVMNKKDVGLKIDELLEKYISTFVRCGFGCLNLVAEMMRDDPFDVYLAERRNASCDAQGRDKEKHLTLTMFMTKADENYPSSVSFWTPETRPYTTMNFALDEHEGFFLPELTQRCMMRLEGIDGISRVESGTRSAGMGFKRRNQFEVFFEGVSEEKRFTAAIKEQYTSKIRSEIVPKVFAIARDLKPKMEARGELMRKNVEASLTPAQRKMVEEHNKNKNP